MHRSSESIAALAAALAKAQSELSNPEKSLVGTIGSDRPGEGPRSFRYAPLSSGLDIVRKALGQQQIATVQTTAIDASTEIVSLTTILAHASGEWIASDWPVCRLADTAAPHRMGAALTYARRYALFTLVGIAGEDDLDAPDLNAGPQAGPPRTPPGTALEIAPSPRSRRHAPVLLPLDPDASAAFRKELIREIASLPSAEEAAQWARSALGTKNRLTASDARLVELAFELRLSVLAGKQPVEPAQEEARTAGMAAPPSESADSATAAEEAANGPATAVPDRGTPNGIDKSVLPFPEVRRYRDKAHIRFVASRPCLVCGRKPCDPHHLRFAQVRAFGRKVSDEFTVPLCRLHHRELHRARNEALWWKKMGIDAVKIARMFWDRTRSLPETRPVSNLSGAQAQAAPDRTAPTARAGRSTAARPSGKPSVSAAAKAGDLAQGRPQSSGPAA
jgi:hypothetical protein